MDGVGDAYDNAMVESFFASLEKELLDCQTFKSKAEARIAVFSWIEGWYNPHRRHSALGQRSPAWCKHSNSSNPVTCSLCGS